MGKRMSTRLALGLILLALALDVLVLVVGNRLV